MVDHVVPHRGDMTLFWDVANWQSLCATHHNATKKRQESRGTMPGVDAGGRPIDPQHPWNRTG